MTNGMKRSPLAGSKYSSFLPEYSWWRDRSKSVRLWIPSISCHPKGKEVLDVERGLRVVGQLVGAVLVEAKPLRGHAQAADPLHAAPLPRLEPLRVGARLDEVLHLHLLELPHPEDEVAGSDLVPERLPYLCDPEGDFLPRRFLDVAEVDVYPLGGFGPQIDGGCLVLDGSHEGVEHQVELARLRKRARHPAGGALNAIELVGAEAAVAVAALDERIREPLHVAAGLPHARVHEDSGIHALHVGPAVHHLLPPGSADVVLELDPERPVVVYGSHAPVNLGGLKDESAPLAQRRELVHQVRRMSARAFAVLHSDSVWVPCLIHP